MNKDKIIIIAGGILIILAVAGISVFLSKSSDTATSIPEDQIVAKNGLHWHPSLEIYI